MMPQRAKFPFDKRYCHLLFAVVIICLGMSACKPAPLTPARTEPPSPQLPANVRELIPAAVQVLLDEPPPGLKIVDVRTEGEAKDEGRLPGAEIYDYLHGEDTIQKLDKLDRKNPVLVYCAIGGRARFTAARMAAMGFTKVMILKGGFNAWVAEGRAVQK